MATNENELQKKTNFKTIALVVLALFILMLITTGVAYFVAKTISSGTLPKPMNNTKTYQTYDAGEFLTNLSDRGYIKFSMVYMLNNREVEKELDIKDSEIRDRVFTILRAKTYDSVKDSEGMDELRAEIKEAINTVLINSNIEDVFFTSIIVN